MQTIHCSSVQASGDPRFISLIYIWCSSPKKKKKKFNLKQSHQAWAGAQPFYHYYVATGFIMKKKSLKERKLIWKSSLSPTRGRNLGVEVTWTGKQKALQLHKCHAGSTRGSSSPPSSFLQKHNRGIDTGRQFVSLIFFFWAFILWTSVVLLFNIPICRTDLIKKRNNNSQLVKGSNSTLV